MCKCTRGSIPELEFLGLKVCVCLSWVSWPYYLPRRSHQFTVPPVAWEGCLFLTASLSWDTSTLFFFCQCDRWETLHHRGFHLSFPYGAAGRLFIRLGVTWISLFGTLCSFFCWIIALNLSWPCLHHKPSVPLSADHLDAFSQQPSLAVI